ncbi:MAG TPA: hypothetical protein VGJ15_04935, partial [Pirellulales bacterium]
IGWGLVALMFALEASWAENLIQAVNIVGSIFYPVMLGLFMVGFFLPWVGANAVFFGAIWAQVLVIGCFLWLPISYVWYNPIGCLACMFFSVFLQAVQRFAFPPASPPAA